MRATVRRLEAGERAAAVGLLALPVAFGLHALVDYDLDYLAVLAPTVLVCAALLGAGRPLVEPRRGTLAAAAIGFGAVLALLALLLPARANRSIDEAYRQVDAGKLAAAASAARHAQRLNPLSLDALYARATVAGVARDNRAAEAFYEQATRLQPQNPDTWYQLGIFRYTAGNLCGAYHALNSAYTLDPKSSLFDTGGIFDQAKAAVNDPKHPACGR